MILQICLETDHQYSRAEHLFHSMQNGHSAPLEVGKETGLAAIIKPNTKLPTNDFHISINPSRVIMKWR